LFLFGCGFVALRISGKNNCFVIVLFFGYL